MYKMKKIADVFPLVDGLFSKMEYDFKFIDKSQLDILFLSSYSQKTCSPLVDSLLTDISLQSSQLAALADMVLKVHKNKWDRHLNVYEIVYEPIYNYIDELTETITIETTETSDNTSNIADGGTVEKTINNTKTNNLRENIVNSSTDKVYGFNSESSVNSDENNLNSEKTDTGTITDSGTNSETRNLVKDIVGNSSVNSDSERTRTSTHKGNIGNITSQHLLKEEIELWKWNVIHEILSDVKDLLTIPMYI